MSDAVILIDQATRGLPTRVGKLFHSDSPLALAGIGKCVAARIIAVDLTGPFLGTQRVVSEMLKRSTFGILFAGVSEQQHFGGVVQSVEAKPGIPCQATTKAAEQWGVP